MKPNIWTFIDPVIVLSILMLLFFSVMACGLFVWKRFCAFLCFIVCIDVGDHINPYNSTTFPCPSKAMTWISNVICHGPFIIVQCLEEVVHFVDIGGIVDHRLLKFHFIILRIFIRLSTNRLQFYQVFINDKQSEYHMISSK